VLLASGAASGAAPSPRAGGSQLASASYTRAAAALAQHCLRWILRHCRASGSTHERKFTVGQRVSAKWKGGKDHYRGVIGAAEPDGTYVIQ